MSDEASSVPEDPRTELAPSALGAKLRLVEDAGARANLVARYGPAAMGRDEEAMTGQTVPPPRGEQEAPDRLSTKGQGRTGGGSVNALTSRERARRDAQACPRWQRRYLRALVVMDALVAVGAVAVADRLLGPVPPGAWGLPVVTLAAVTLGRGYEHRFLGQGTAEYRWLLTAYVELVALAGLIALATSAPWLRALVLVGLPTALVGSLLAHAGARWILHELRRAGVGFRRCVVIGLERSVAELVRSTRRDPEAGLAVVAACIARTEQKAVEAVPIAGRPGDVLAVLEETGADTVVLTAWSDVTAEELRRLSWDLEGTGIRLLVASRLTDIATPRMHVRTVDGTALLDIDQPEFTGVRRVIKNAMDYVLTVPGLILIAPLMAMVALAVRIDSSGPVLYRQQRIGRNGREFTMHKFRSMVVDADRRKAELAHLNAHGDAPIFKIDGDPRITRVGRVIRRYSLDELPQLFDVLAGRMSLVGPRPPLPDEVAAYAADTHRRLLVKPGITGLWQVSGRSDLTWDETVRLDLHYVENWSLPLDLSIIARTVTAVFGRSGAY